MRPAPRFALLVALVPLIAALTAHAVPTRVTPLAPPPDRPPLTFEQYAVDLREVAPRPVIQAHFDFINTGSGPVEITRLDPSCGCLHPQIYGGKQVFRPGERGRFYVTMHTAREAPGPHAYTVTVHYADPQPREERLLLRLSLPQQKVSVEPAEVLFYQLSGEESEKTVYVTDLREGGLRVLNAACDLAGVSVEVLPPETTPEGLTRVPVRLRVPGEYPSGRHMGWLRIATSDPEFAQLKAAIFIYGSGVQPAAFEHGR